MNGRSFFQAREGATAIEYGLIAALIAIVALTSAGAYGKGLLDGYLNIGEQIENAGKDPPGDN